MTSDVIDPGAHVRGVVDIQDAECHGFHFQSR